MWRPAASIILASVAASAQTNSFDKAPPDVNDALRARVNEFYQDHVDGKFRKAEGLVADEAKDSFYAATKPALLAFRLGDISYTEGYTKAKVTLLGKIMMQFMGMAAPQLMEVPFPSYWKLEGGKWSWYVFTDPNRMTPFGKLSGKSSPASDDPAQAYATAPNIATILDGVKADKKAITLSKAPGSRETITLRNELKGPVTLSCDPEQYSGLKLSLEPKELKAGESAKLTLESSAAQNPGSKSVRVLVKPSNQAIDITVSFQQ